MAVFFYFHETDLKLDKRKSLKRFIEELFRAEGRHLAKLAYIFCTDEYLLSINQQYLQHDTYTDILTFDLSDSPRSVIGEIYISADRVRENAQKFGLSFENELYRVIFHGALHLCGQGDKTKNEQKAMRNKEEKYLKQYRMIKQF